jgi:hypothetical protein
MPSFTLGALVCYRGHRHHRNHPSDTEIGVVTQVGQFGDYQINWLHYGIGWYADFELEPYNKKEEK